MDELNDQELADLHRKAIRTRLAISPSILVRAATIIE
jgi:hypothetical protein